MERNGDIKGQNIDSGGLQWYEPLTPGQVIYKRLFIELNITNAEFSQRFGISRTRLSRIFSGKQKINADAANCFGEAFHLSPMFFMNLQSQYDLEMSKRQKIDDRSLRMSNNVA